MKRDDRLKVEAIKKDLSICLPSCLKSEVSRKAANYLWQRGYRKDFTFDMLNEITYADAIILLLILSANEEQRQYAMNVAREHLIIKGALEHKDEETLSISQESEKLLKEYFDIEFKGDKND